MPASLAWSTIDTGGFSLTNGADFTTAGDFTNGDGTLTVGVGAAAGSTLTVAGNFTQTSAGALNVQIGGTPASGQFGQVASQRARPHWRVHSTWPWLTASRRPPPGQQYDRDDVRQRHAAISRHSPG